MAFRFRPVSGLHLDTLRVVGYTRAPGTFWVQQRGNLWAAGEWEVGWNERDARGQFWAQAGADVCWTDKVDETMLVAGLTCECGITRIDLCRDVVGFPVSNWVRNYFSGTRMAREVDENGAVVEIANGKMEYSDTGNTLYIGRRESDTFLRIYEKWDESKTKEKVPQRLRDEWEQYGWAGEPVQRIEFEMKRDSVCRVVEAGREGGWGDCLARIRLIANPRQEVKKAANARTHIDWRKLGNPGKVRIASQPESPLLVKAMRAADQLRRKADAAGVAFHDYIELMRYLGAGASTGDGWMSQPDFTVTGKRGQVIQLKGAVKRGALDDVGL